MNRPTVLYKRGETVQLDYGLTADAIVVDEDQVPSMIANGWVRNPYTDLIHAKKDEEKPSDAGQGTAVIRESESDESEDNQEDHTEETKARRGRKRKEEQ